MSKTSLVLIALASFLSAFLFHPTLHQARADGVDPRLVTFGPLAAMTEGDHDHRQFLRLSVPADAGKIYIRGFDVDTAGAHDEKLGAHDTKTRFALYGAGVVVELSRDEKGVIQEALSGTALAEQVFGRNGGLDDRWTTLFSVDASQGEVAGDNRIFVIAVEGVSGNDGNLFEIAASTSAEHNEAVAGARLYSYMPTFQVPRDDRLAELRFDVPEDAGELVIENFDAADGRINYAGRFRSAKLLASGRGTWQDERLALEGDEPGGPASVTVANGGENPNDVTVFVGLGREGEDAVSHPVAIDLPIRAFGANLRPEPVYAVTQNACAMMGFDAGGSSDSDGRVLQHHWRFARAGEAFGDAVSGASLAQGFDRPGAYRGRLEVYDDSGLVGSGAAREFGFFVKAAPVAALLAPTVAVEGEAVSFDGSASTASAWTGENRIIRYHWRFGDGVKLVQEEGDAEFGGTVRINVFEAIMMERKETSSWLLIKNYLINFWKVGIRRSCFPRTV